MKYVTQWPFTIGWLLTHDWVNSEGHLTADREAFIEVQSHQDKLYLLNWKQALNGPDVCVAPSLCVFVCQREAAATTRSRRRCPS